MFASMESIILLKYNICGQLRYDKSPLCDSQSTKKTVTKHVSIQFTSQGILSLVIVVIVRYHISCTLNSVLNLLSLSLLHYYLTNNKIIMENALLHILRTTIHL